MPPAAGSPERKAVDASESLLRVAPHKQVAIDETKIRKSSLQVRQNLKSTEVKINHIIEAFQQKARLNHQASIEKQDRDYMLSQKHQNATNAKEWAEFCKEEHVAMMSRRDEQLNNRRAQLQSEAKAMAEAVKLAKTTQTQADVDKCRRLKAEFAQRKADYKKEQAIREATEGEQARKVVEAYKKQTAMMKEEREAEQKARQDDLAKKKAIALVNKQRAQEQNDKKKAKERELILHKKRAHEQLMVREAEEAERERETRRKNNAKMKEDRMRANELREKQRRDKIATDLKRVKDARKHANELKEKAMMEQMMEKQTKRDNNLAAKAKADADKQKFAEERQARLKQQIQDDKAEAEKRKTKLEAQAKRQIREQEARTQKANDEAARKIAQLKKMKLAS